MRPLFLLVITLSLLALPTLAQEDRIGHFGAWQAIKFSDKGQRVCYMIAHPISMSLKGEKLPPPPKKKKGKKAKVKKATPLPREAYITITFRPSDSLNPVFSYEAGAMLRDNTEAVLAVAKQNFSLFTAQDGAWARTSGMDQAIAKALRQGSALEIRAVTAKSGTIRARFNIKGADAAYKKIAGACGIQ